MDTFEIKKLVYLAMLNLRQSWKQVTFDKESELNLLCTVLLKMVVRAKLKQPRDSRVPRGALKATASGRTPTLLSYSYLALPT